MRLTCPNCEAQYEVPDEVIPSEGRDVQCSNCGDTWYQNHADAPDPIEAAPVADNEGVHVDVEEADPPKTETPLQEEMPHQEPLPSQGHLDSSVKDILREEADLEAQIRAEETGSSLESQPGLGLDDVATSSKNRKHDTQDPAARILGSETIAPAEADPISIPDSRRGLLPDIEQINSTLHAESDKPNGATAVGPVSVSAKTKNKSSFARGFAVAILIAAVFVMIYMNAPRIAQSFPQVDPALNAYVAGIDQTRLWLDNKIGDLIPGSEE